MASVMSFLSNQGSLILMGLILGTSILSYVTGTKSLRLLKRLIQIRPAGDGERQSQSQETEKGLLRSRREKEMTAARAEEVDEGLLQLKQSLERIAASRDQRQEEETAPKKRRVLTSSEQKVIADILAEYLA